MEQQKKMKIDVCYILNDNFNYCPKEWLKEDYLIQNEEILVEICIKDHTAPNINTSYLELITCDKSKIEDKIQKFNILKDRAIPYGKQCNKA